MPEKMIIANSIYDIVFKRIIGNERIAKFFIGTLSEQHIESVEVNLHSRKFDAW